MDEAEVIGSVVDKIDRNIVDRVIVVDNGSSDDTANVAKKHGAKVLKEPRRGYGSACLKGIAAAPDANIFVFLDGDGSDDPKEIESMLLFMKKHQADLVIGSRVLGESDPGALTGVQKFGNALTCSLVRMMWGVSYTDLGPFRAIGRDALKSLNMSDLDFGWTIEMQVKAAQRGLKVVEMPVRRYCRKAGKSKVSGNLKGSILAGKTILGYVFKSKLKELF